MKLKIIHIWPFLAYVAGVAVGVAWLPVEYISTATPFLGLVGSTVYMVLFSSRNWEADPFMRALMLGAVTFWLMFLQGVIRISITGRPAVNSDDGLLMALVSWSFNILVLTSIWYKAVTLYALIRKGYLDDLARA